MAGFLRDYSILSKFLFVFEVIGETFLDVSQCANVIRKFVVSNSRKRVHDCEMGSQNVEVEDAQFVSEGKSLLFLNGSLANNGEVSCLSQVLFR